ENDRDHRECRVRGLVEYRPRNERGRDDAARQVSGDASAGEHERSYFASFSVSGRDPPCWVHVPASSIPAAFRSPTKEAPTDGTSIVRLEPFWVIPLGISTPLPS